MYGVDYKVLGSSPLFTVPKSQRRSRWSPMIWKVCPRTYYTLSQTDYQLTDFYQDSPQQLLSLFHS